MDTKREKLTWPFGPGELKCIQIFDGDVTI